MASCICGSPIIHLNPNDCIPEMRQRITFLESRLSLLTEALEQALDVMKEHAGLVEKSRDVRVTVEALLAK